MKFFPSRLLRVESEYRVEVRLHDNKNGALLPSACSGVMVNISKGGACLVLFKMLIEGRHLFFSTLNDGHHHLVLLIENPALSNETFMIPARSVWMDSYHYKGEPAFKIGLCFHEKQQNVFQIFKKLRRQDQV